MASPYEPLISSTRTKPTSFPCKPLLITLSLTTLICLTSLITIQLNTPTTTTLQPSDLCINSPNPSTCHTIVADLLTIKSTPLHVLNTLIAKSLYQIKSTQLALNSKPQSAPLADCAQLMDMSHDRLAESVLAVASGAHSDARTWLSAVLANHDTCLDGLSGEARDQSELESHLKILMDHASATLAVLNAVSTSFSSSQEHVGDFPSWMPIRDRKLLEGSGRNGFVANVVVAQDGSGKFSKVQDAVNFAPSGGSSRYVIYVKKGVYKENVVIPKAKTNLVIVGDGMTATVISASVNVVDGATTFNSATLAANADGLILQDLGIQNTAGAIKHQAVALRVSGDKATINRCQIDGYQDTLYTHILRQFYRDSTISGTVDFIFGDAGVVFQNCNILARLPLSNQQNTITAQGRIDPNENTGITLQNCQIKAASDLVPAEGSIQTYLGRPWKLYSRTVVMQSYIDKLVNPKGWLPWNGTFALDTLFYGEYLNTGPGAGTAGRVNWAGFKVITSASDASLFTVAALIQGGQWLSSTGVAFTEGLL